MLGTHSRHLAWSFAQSCDHIEDTMLPDGTLGTDYVVKAATYPGSTAYLVRVVATEDATTVTFDPATVSAPVTLAKAGDVADVSGTDVVVRVTSDRRVVVAGLNEGDNTLALFAPTARFRSDYVFYVPEFQHDYLKLLVPDLAGAELLLDDAPLDTAGYAPIGASGHRWGIVAVTSGPHRVRTSKANGAAPPFGLMVYGNQDPGYVPGGLPSAYEYPGGLDLHEATDRAPK